MKTTYIKLEGSYSILAYAFTGEETISLYDPDDSTDSHIQHMKLTDASIQKRLNDPAYVRIDKSEFLLIRTNIEEKQKKYLESLSK